MEDIDEKCTHQWFNPYSILLGFFANYAYCCSICGETIISDNGPIPELEKKKEKTKEQG